ncbi:hypothetical protein OHC33_009853 [Knufia fluminis]|uniref:Uncharacterized protein n=1 Tax=Knufia fluminis TaxID=191047 RepID=A0AAN8I1I5_9EURO|nr:hypothetical protein OHC33_009853 [Knufia fluminis]
MSNNTSQSCTIAPPNIPSDAGIAGAGILIAFITTATLALLLSSYLTLSTLRPSASSRIISLTTTIARQLLGGLSDQQLISGISIQSLALARLHTITPYHFFIIWMLSLLSTATNFAALLALVQDFKRDWVLRWLRQAAMFVNMGLGVVLGVLVLEVQLKKLPETMAVGCVWDEGFKQADLEKEGGNNVLSVVGTIAVIAASAIIFALGTWYLHLRVQIWGRFVRVVSLVILWAVAVAATVRVVTVSQAFGTPSVELADEGERQWSFGQLLSLVLLVLPLISALEIYRGQLKVAACEGEKGEVVESDQVPLTAGGNGKASVNRFTYQPNPWFK